MTVPKISVLMPVITTESWQVEMTKCAISTMRCTTKIDYRLIVVETLSRSFDTSTDISNVDRRIVKETRGFLEWEPIIDDVFWDYLHRPERTAQVLDLNAGLDMCDGDYVVYTGNDVFMRPGWLEALLECFEIADCGIACLGMSELGHKPERRITEGFSGPLMMFKHGWRFDEAFREVFIDADLCMRVYKSGLRSYRNLRVVAVHLLQQTSAALDDQQTREQWFREGKETFDRRHQDSPLLMYRVLSGGQVI